MGSQTARGCALILDLGGKIMAKYVLKRLLLLIPVLLGVSFVIFFILDITPGDPAAIILGEAATPEAIAQLNAELGLDKPFFARYLEYMRKLIFEQDMGVSYQNSRSVSAAVFERVPVSMKLALAGIAISGKSSGAAIGCFDDEMLVMCHMLSDQLDAFLRAMRECGMPPIALKAVLTPTNVTWNSLTLHDELSREHDAMQRRVR